MRPFVIVVFALASGLSAGQTLSIDAGGRGDRYFSPPDSGPRAVNSCTGGTCRYTDAKMGAGTLRTLRYGFASVPFTYSLPIASARSTCSGKLTMVEPNKSGPGQRVFVISVEGQQSPSIDLFALTGGPAAGYKPYVYQFSGVAAAGVLTLTFTPSVGDALVNQIDVSCVAATPASRRLTSTVPGQGVNPLDSSYLPNIDTNPADYPANIWVTDTMQKVRQDAGLPGADHWGTFFGTQNEFVDFQVHLHDTGNGTPNVTVTASDFVNPTSRTTIAASSTNIVVYREAYVNVSGTPSNIGSSTYYKALGYYPDILIPTKDPYWRQTTNAWPVNVAPNQNQSAWIDILIPPAAPAGFYAGTVTVKSGTTTLATLPIIIAVWQWPTAQGGQMPSTTSLKTQVINWVYNGLCTSMYSADYTTPNCGSYPGAGGANDAGNTMIWLDASLIMKDHRYTMGGLQNIFPQAGSFDVWDTYVGPLMNGGCLLHGGSGRTCPLLAGSRQTTKTLDFLPPATTAIWSNWKSHFDSKGWGSTLQDNLVDEPHTVAEFKTLVANAATRHALLSPGVPEAVTTDIWFGQFTQAKADAFSVSVCGAADCILNSIDILVPTIYYFDYDDPSDPTVAPPQSLALYQAWMSKVTSGVKREWWTYGACPGAGTCTNGVPGPAPEGIGSGNVWNYPNMSIDGMPAANRVMEWLSALHGNTGELYFAADVCNGMAYHAVCVASGQTWDPWNGVYYSGEWGAGTLVYAGGATPGMVNYVGVKTPILLPSVRLKHVRDGMQDYEYVTALKNAGQGVFAQQQISSWITNSYTFETTGSGLQTARQQLGKALHQLTYSVLK